MTRSLSDVHARQYPDPAPTPGECRDAWGPRCEKKARKKACFKKKKPTVARKKMITKCAKSCGFCSRVPGYVSPDAVAPPDERTIPGLENSFG